MNKTTWLTNRLVRLSYYEDHSQLIQALSFIMLWVEGIIPSLHVRHGDTPCSNVSTDSRSLVLIADSVVFDIFV
jgi:hypothetical protein